MKLANGGKENRWAVHSDRSNTKEIQTPENSIYTFPLLPTNRLGPHGYSLIAAPPGLIDLTLDSSDEVGI